MIEGNDVGGLRYSLPGNDAIRKEGRDRNLGLKAQVAPNLAAAQTRARQKER